MRREAEQGLSGGPGWTLLSVFLHLNSTSTRSTISLRDILLTYSGKFLVFQSVTCDVPLLESDLGVFQSHVSWR